MLFLEFVLFGIGRRVAAQPEVLDEGFTLFVVVELLKSSALFIGDDITDVFVQPLLVGSGQLVALLLLLGFAFLLRHGTGDGFALRRGFLFAGVILRPRQR